VSLSGEAGRDCKVDLLDLVFARDRLFADVEEGESEYAGITGDGEIKIADLIAVRNNLGATCDD